MADALWQSPSMRALRPQFEDEHNNGNACILWQLPNWDEYSESGASVSASERSRLDISVCSSDAVDFGDDSSSSGVDDDPFTRGKLRRSPVSIARGGGGSLPKRKSVLQQLHLRYAKQRQLEEFTSRDVRTNNRSDSRAGEAVDAPVLQTHSEPARAPSDDRDAAKDRAMAATATEVAVPPVTGSENVTEDAKAIAAQQSVLNSQLQSFRSQLTEMQKRITSDSPITAANSTLSPVGAEQQLSRPSLARDRYDMSMQTDGTSLRDDTVVQWLNLLAQKIVLLASDYEHDATQSYRATVQHIAGLKIAAQPAPPSREEPQQNTTSTSKPNTPQPSTWHVGGALQAQLSAPTAAKFVELEASLARLSSAFERSSQCKLELFEKSIRQIEQFHHEKLQQIVNESIDELKQVRSKYKARQEQLEEQVRLATRSADEWRQKSVEIEHKSTCEREKIEFRAATFREKFERLSVRFEEDIVNITEQLDAARREKSEAQRHQTASDELENLKQKLASLQKVYDGLNSKRESEIKVFEQEQQRWKVTLEQLHHENDAVVQEITTEKQLLAKSLEDATQRHASEIARLKNQFQMEVEDTYRATIVSEKIVDLQRRHEKQLETLRESYEQQVEEQGRAVEKALKEVRESRQVQVQVSSAATQTEPSAVTLHSFDRHHSASEREAEVRIQELSRKCRALENLLDKKFEQQSTASSQYGGGSMSPLCMSCNNSNSSNSVKTDSPRSQTSLRSSENVVLLDYEAVSSKLAHVDSTSSHHRLAWKTKEFAASSHAATSLDDALFTDINTTMRNETWDSTSMTSIDTFEPSVPSPYQALSRPQSASRSINKGNGVPSNADILALVRKLETYAATSPILNNEPEPEQSIVFRTPESRATSTRKAQPPPIYRTSRHLKRDASAAARKLNRPSTSLTQRPLRGSLLSVSSASSSSGSSSSAENQRPGSGRAMSAATTHSRAPRSRFI